MLIYSKLLTAEMHILWAILPLYVQMHHTYSKVNVRCPFFPAEYTRTVVHSMFKDHLLMKPLYSLFSFMPQPNSFQWNVDIFSMGCLWRGKARTTARPHHLSIRATPLNGQKQSENLELQNLY